MVRKSSMCLESLGSGMPDRALLGSPGASRGVIALDRLDSTMQFVATFFNSFYPDGFCVSNGDSHPLPYRVCD